MRTNFRVPVKYVFTGEFTVKADDVYQAIAMVRNNCGMNCGEVYAALPEEHVVDWEFDMTPEVVIFPDEEDE